ncbi:MAG: ATP-binding protein [Gammaproteobacteria bacterium]|nr:ATP-binding protein [Gammaproteobacteria bacterium]
MEKVSKQPLLEHVLSLRHRISSRLGLALAGAVSLTLIASFVGLIYLDQINKAQKRVYEVSMPDMEAAFSFSLKSGEVVSAAPRLTSATTEEELESIRIEVEADKRDFRLQLDSILTRGLDASLVKEVSGLGDTLLQNIDTVSSLVTDRFVLTAQLNELQSEFSLLATTLENNLISAGDMQLFYFVTGFRDRDTERVPESEHFTLEEFSRYRHLVELRRFASRGVELLSSALSLPDSPFIETLKDQFETNEFGVARTLSQLEMDDFYETTSPMFTRLTEIGLEENGIFETKSALFRLDEQKETIFEFNRQLGAQLVADIEELVRVARSDTASAAESSASAVATGRLLLIIVNVVSVIGAGIISVFYVGNRILRRLDHLSERMRSMADGDLESEIRVEGNDEIAEMAHALEVFRRHALEVQRLNLVEKLAQELSEKNDELENANEDLRRAQDQIVMREKLVALGELTAGVAHEIRNPLNFIMNFSELSEELLDEIVDELIDPEKKKEADAEMDKQLVEENVEDLTSNLKRIREHGGRANRIIDDMLKMGRGTREFSESNINALLDEHAKLAFHSARAADNTFELALEFDLDETIGDIRIVPQDIGRVFINMVSNAGYAANEKFQEIKANDPTIDFIPTLTCTTKKEGDRVLVTFRDNGTGMPQSVIDKIFNPFFTTKPTDKGTGLGLALSNDIVREHGGSIRVTSEPGEWTQMIVDLPSDPSEFIGKKTNDDEIADSED